MPKLWFRSRIFSHERHGGDSVPTVIGGDPFQKNAACLLYKEHETLLLRAHSSSNPVQALGSSWYRGHHNEQIPDDIPTAKMRIITHHEKSKQTKHGKEKRQPNRRKRWKPPPARPPPPPLPVQRVNSNYFLRLLFLPLFATPAG